MVLDTVLKFFWNLQMTSLPYAHCPFLSHLPPHPLNNSHLMMTFAVQPVSTGTTDLNMKHYQMF